ncbi:putative Clp domain superfamily, ATP-dependent Clp protease ATP-binding subunit CLPT1/2 [Helianthus annuus]|nr:putative Clp domain superfamily, ATP-dependent Clp protease ATP-binding subunit CLPT1/2 [Helianthus annuus]
MKYKLTLLILQFDWDFSGHQRKQLRRNQPSKWSFRFIKSFAMGELEARKLKYNNTGTESLLLGILVEGQ